MNARMLSQALLGFGLVVVVLGTAALWPPALILVGVIIVAYSLFGVRVDG